MWAELRVKLDGLKHFLVKIVEFVMWKTKTIIIISGLDERLHYHLRWLNWLEQKRLFELKTRRCHSSHFLPWLLEQTPSCNYNSIGGGGVIINPLCSTGAHFNKNNAGGGALFVWYDQMQLCGLWRDAVRKKMKQAWLLTPPFSNQSRSIPFSEWSSLSLFSVAD